VNAQLREFAKLGARSDPSLYIRRSLPHTSRMVVRARYWAICVLILASGCVPDTDGPVVESGEAGSGGDDGGGGKAGGKGGNSAGNGGATAGKAGASGGTSGAPTTGGTAGDPVCDLEVGDGGPWSAALPCGSLGDLSAERGAVIDLGHTAEIEQMVKSGNRLLSVDALGDWVLWNLEAQSVLARGRVLPPLGWETVQPSRVALVGDVLAVLQASTDEPDSATLEIRSASDGTLLSAPAIGGLSAASSCGIARDGSYVWVIDPQGLSAWSPAGLELMRSDREFFPASTDVFAAPGELRLGQLGAAAVETISVMTGDVSSSPSLPGGFRAWFDDGARLLTTSGRLVRVLSSTSFLEEASILLNADPDLLDGSGEHFWTTSFDFTTNNDVVTVHPVSDPQAALEFQIEALAKPSRAGTLLAFVPVGETELLVLDLAEAEVTQQTINVPSDYGNLFAADAVESYAISRKDGGVVDSDHLDRSLSCGRVQSIAGSPAGEVAIATSIGGILRFEISDASRSYLGDLPIRANRIELSDDGGLLGAMADGSANASITVVDTANGGALISLPLSGDASFAGFELSADGSTLVSQSFGESGEVEVRVFGVDGTEHFRDGSIPLTVPKLSLNGQLLASATATSSELGVGTQIFQGQDLIAMFDGYPVVWLDNERLLVNTVPTDRNTRYGVAVYTSEGEVESRPVLPPLQGVQLISSRELYSESRNEVFDLETNDSLWRCATAHPLPQPPGGATPGYVVFVDPARPYKVLFDDY
jgi:hypothetical protein